MRQTKNNSYIHVPPWESVKGNEATEDVRTYGDDADSFTKVCFGAGR